jgi:hypothetical protein
MNQFPPLSRGEDQGNKLNVELRKYHLPDEG